MVKARPLDARPLEARPLVLPKIPIRRLNSYSEETKEFVSSVARRRVEPDDEEKKPFVQHMKTLD